MRILFAGTPEAAVPSLEALLASPHDIVGVLTRADAPQGRGRHLVPSPVKARALAEGLPVITDRPRGPEFLAQLAALQVEAVAVVAYGEILHPETLDAVPNGWVNLHFSVLPAWRGAAPVQRAVIAGDEYTGATTFVITEGLDSGPVLGVLTQRIDPRWTAGDLMDALAASGAHLLVATMDAIADGSALPVAQVEDGVSHAPKLTVEEGHVDWSRPAMHLDRLVRGFTPNPGAWTTTPAGQRLGLGPLTVVPDRTDLAPGEVEAGKRQVLVGTGTHAVALSTVAPQGKKEMAAPDWARGARLEADARLGVPATGTSDGVPGGASDGAVSSDAHAPEGRA